jgi:basic amino acid/polyamine antiporter, APA family
MDENKRPKPADIIVHPRRIKRYRLRRVLGVPALFSTGYGDVGSSIYYALGIVALVALGATPIVLALAGVIYIFNALTYSEGSTMFPEAGGSASFARHGFNDLGGFIGGWALMLSYITTIAVSANTIPPYLAYFLPALKEPIFATATAMGIIVLLMLVNVVGVKESTRINIFFIGIDITTQLVLIISGIILIVLVNPSVLFQHMFGAGNWPTTGNLIFGIALAALAFTGVESVSQIAQEARRPAKQIPRAYTLMIVVVLVLFGGISIAALSAMTPQVLGDPVNGWARDPVAGIAANLPSATLRAVFAPLVAVLASTILLTGTNAGIIGISRLSYNLSIHRQLPGTFSRVHPRFRTPHIAIIVFGLIALILMVPGFFLHRFFADLGALYAFGSLLSFAIAHAAIISLRVKKPDLPRPFKLRLNIRIRGREVPLTAILGLGSTVGVWIILAAGQPFTRIVGFIWIACGIIAYYLYRRKQHIPLTSTSLENRLSIHR